MRLCVQNPHKLLAGDGLFFVQILGNLEKSDSEKTEEIGRLNRVINQKDVEKILYLLLPERSLALLVQSV